MQFPERQGRCGEEQGEKTPGAPGPRLTAGRLLANRSDSDPGLGALHHPPWARTSLIGMNTPRVEAPVGTPLHQREYKEKRTLRQSDAQARLPGARGSGTSQQEDVHILKPMEGFMTEAIGWFSSFILVLTIGKQVYKQWSSGSSEGVSKWLFVGQITASAGFTLYSVLVRNWVFVVTNALLLVSAIVGGLIVIKHRRTQRAAHA